MKTLRLGVAGLGNVGCGLLELMERQTLLRLPGALAIAGVSARNRSRNRSVPLDQYPWFDDPVELAGDSSVDVFVELIGGAEGAAPKAIETALRAKKPVVTANKALIAEHGHELSKIAKTNGVDLLFEAAVAGGVPIVRVIRDSLSGVEVSRITGILNGTCNFLTTEMLETGRPYDAVLEEAQRLGFAEADPFLDVSGTDAAHKAAILSSIAFSADIDFSKVSIDGVADIELGDLQFADRLGYRIKLIAEGVLSDGGVVCRVEPKALPKKHMLARVGGSLNTIQIEGDPIGSVVLTGPGAGAGPTASAVMGDIAKLFTPSARAAFGEADHHQRRAFVTGSDDEVSAYFIRTRLADRSGALAEMTEALASEGVSIDKLMQDSADEDGNAPIAIVTHTCTAKEIAAARARLAKAASIVDAPRLIRIEAAAN